MVIGLLILDLHIPHARSLKDKRMVLNRFRDRVRNRYNAALAELEHQDKWQRARVGVVTLNSQAHVVEELLQRVLNEATGSLDAEVAGHEIRYF
ncbi:MAG: DUF503 domain-containing protein [Candidatus Aminicenantes bacterium]|nr:DUF503 domain-containing protein [Candidatus Aminicenantes bacterium]